MFLERFVRSPTGKIIMSILLGLGLATLFRQVCAGKECLEYVSPPPEVIEGQVYKINNKCYKFNKNSVSCDSNKKMLDLE